MDVQVTLEPTKLDMPDWSDDEILLVSVIRTTFYCFKRTELALFIVWYFCAGKFWRWGRRNEETQLRRPRNDETRERDGRTRSSR